MARSLHAVVVRLSPRAIRCLDSVRVCRRWKAAPDPPSRETLPVRARARTARTVAREHRLMFAVLEDAVRILRTRRSSRIVAETRDWVLSNDTTWPVSFRNVCDALDVGADDLRRRLMPWLGNGTHRVQENTSDFAIADMNQGAASWLTLPQGTVSMES